MPTGDLQDAIKEAYAAVPSSIVILETIEVYHEDAASSIYMVRNREPWTAYLEDGTTEVTFEPVPFRFSLPKKDDSGVPELTIAVDNVDRRASDYLDSVKNSGKPVFVKYRPYLSNDPSGPQMNPPLILQLKDVRINLFEVSGRATFHDVRNKKFPNERYTRSRFPSIGG